MAPREDHVLPDEGEEQYRRLFQHMTEGFFLAEVICDADGRPIDYRYLDANPAVESLTGLKREAIIGKTVREVLPGAEQEWIDTYGRVALTGQPTTIEAFAGPLGRYYSTVAYCPRRGQFACLFSDVTERKRAEGALREREAELREQRSFLRTVLDLVSSMVMVRDAQGRCLLANEAAARFHGMTVQAIEGLDCREIPSMPPEALQQDRHVLESGRDAIAEIEVEGADGHRHSLITTRTPLVDSAGVRDRVLVTAVDITWRKRAEAAIRQSEDRLRLAIDSTELGAFDLDPQTGRLIWSEHAKRHFGLGPDAEVSYDTFLRGLHPDDRERVDRMVQNVLRPESGGEYATEYRTVGIEDRKQRWLSARGRVLFDDGGRAVRFIGVTVDITEQKEAEEALQKSEAQLRAAAIAAEIGMWYWTPGTSHVTVTANWRRLFGVTDDEDVTFETWTAALHPDDRERATSALKLAAAEGRDFAVEYRVVRPDGTLRWLTDRGRASYGENGQAVHMAGVNVDITERKLAEAALQRSTAILEQAGRMAHLGAWQIDLLANPDDINANPLQWSEQVYRIFGYEPGAVAVTNELFFRHVHPDDRARVADAVARAIAEHRSYSVEHRIVRADGVERTVYEHAQIEFDTRGRPHHMVGAVQDITERKDAEHALEDANARLAEADRRKDEFIAILSHELRNPLAPIRYALPVIQRERLTAPAGRAAAVINRQVDHLTRLVDDLLDISRITRGKIDLRREHVTLDSVIGAAVEAASPTVAAARHVLETKVADETIWLHADVARVAQIVTNLLNNSAKYTARGGRIELEGGREDGQAVIRVRDNGMGIPREALPTIFEMFRQVDRPDRTQGGLGIGLALVKRLVEMHEGTIEAHSGGIGLGSEFIVRLPVADEPTTNGDSAVEERAGKGRKLKVLVVDDNADLVEMLAMVVEAAGHDVRKALDGRSAISAALSYRPDVVLLDLGLPIIGGLEVARQLRRHPDTAKARLVALTGWGQADDRRQTQEAGFDAHLTKPTDPEHLQRLLAQFATAIVS